MAFASSRGWFSASRISHSVQSLQDEIAQADADNAGKTHAPAADDTMRLVRNVVILVAVLLLGLLAAATFTGPRERRLTPFAAARYAGMVALLLGGGVIATKYYGGVTRGRRGQRDAALQQLASQGGLRNGFYAPIKGDSVAAIPWLISEIDILVHCELHGRFGEHALAQLECTCVVDVTLSKIEASMGKLAGKIMSHIEHEGVQRRCLDAVVFFEPLSAVPDLFLAPRDEPLHWYFERKSGVSMDVLPGRAYWAGSSDAQACARVITPELERLVKDHGIAIQVFAGYCVVLFKSWQWIWPKDMPHTVEQLDHNLKLACRIHDLLRGDQPRAQVAEPARPLAREVAPSPAAVPMAPAEAVAAAPVLTDRAPVPQQSWHRLIGASIGALVVGALALALDVRHYPPEKQNGTHITAQAVFPMMIGAALGFYIGHRILRNTWRRLIAPGVGTLVCLGIVLAMTVPKQPADKVTFTFVLANALIALMFGGTLGALIGWLIRRARPIG